MAYINKILKYFLFPLLLALTSSVSYAGWDCANATVQITNEVSINSLEVGGPTFPATVTWTSGNSNNFINSGSGVPFGSPLSMGEYYSFIPMGTEGWGNMTSYEHPDITVSFTDDPPEGYQQMVCQVVHTNDIGFELQGGSAGGDCNYTTFPAFGFTFDTTTGKSAKGEYTFKSKLQGTFDPVKTGELIPECGS